MDLDKVYEEMTERWRSQPWSWEADLVRRKCLAIFSLGGWKLEPRVWGRLVRWLEPLAGAGIIYKVRPRAGEGQLHFTFHQLTRFYEGGKFETSIGDEQLREFMKELEGFQITYRGLVLTPTGIALRGFPSSYEKLMKLRERIREIYPEFDPPYINDICHATLFRWTSAPTEEQRAYVLAGLERWEEAVVGSQRPCRWELGTCSLSMLEGTFERHAGCWVATRVAHRGLLDGPSSQLENQPARILEQLNAGKEVECDVWKVGERWFLGHDEPATEISIEDFLKDGSWIHAKNWEAFKELYERRWKDGVDVRFFWHTEEDWVFTSSGEVISYPGCEVLEEGCNMMPERGGKSGGAWVCGDWYLKI